MKIVKYELSSGQYFKAVYQKTNIVLHHTVSSTAMSALSWWEITQERIGTAFVIDKDGTIYQAFDPKYWAHHLGLKSNRNIDLNRRSIGIELVNEGPILKSESGKYWNFTGGAKKVPYKGKTIDFRWRGFDTWAVYTEAQYKALDSLLPHLVDKFKMNASFYDGMDFNPVAPDKATIYSHRNVRPDKTDLSPAFNFEMLTCLKPKILV